MGVHEPEIEKWVASTSQKNAIIDFGDDDDLDSVLALSEVRDVWPVFLETSLRRLLSSKTKSRVSYLKRQILPLAKDSDISVPEALSIFKLLIPTYTRYIDQPSREAAEAVIIALVSSSLTNESEKKTVFEQIVSWIRSEAGRVYEKGAVSSTAPGSRFVLLRWCCTVYICAVKVKTNAVVKEQCSAEWKSLLEATAFLLDSLLSLEVKHSKYALYRTSIVITRRALRSSPKDIPAVLATVLSLAKTAANSGNLHLVTFLGLVCDVIYHLKNVPAELKIVDDASKEEIISLYISSVLLSRYSVPKHESDALTGFFRRSLQPEDITSTLLPAMEKASLRSPEVAIPVITDLFRTFLSDGKQERVRIVGDNETFKRLATLSLNATKSSNAAVRSDAVTLIGVVLSLEEAEDGNINAYSHVLGEILTPAKSGKTSGPEHRLALFSILSFIPATLPLLSLSKELVSAIPQLLSKESNEAAIATLCNTAKPHLISLLSIGSFVGSIPNFVSEMKNAKPAIRRAVFSLVGGAIYETSTLVQNVGTIRETFISSIVPVLENSFSAIISNPLTSPTSPLEGYVGAACLLGPISQYKQFESNISRIANIQTLLGSTAKPSFLLWEKVYTKLSSKEDEQWFLRALDEAYKVLAPELKKKDRDNLRQQFGLAYIYLASSSEHLNIRKEVIKTIEKWVLADPQLINDIVRTALTSYLSRARQPDTNQDKEKYKLRGLTSVLTACAKFSNDIDDDTKKHLLSDLTLLAHHPEVCGASSQLWIDLCQQSKTDPRALIEHQKERILTLILCEEDSKLYQESLRARETAITTLTFVAPDVILPSIVSQIKIDLNPSKFATVTEEDASIWKTPEGTLYVDVLSLKTSSSNNKGKDAALEKWDAEIRASLANKKASSKSASDRTLSKQEKDLVSSQLRAESEVRNRVESIYQDAIRGLSLVRGVVLARVDELGISFSTLVDLLLQIGAKHGERVVGDKLLEVYLGLSDYCSGRLDTFRTWVAIATLRCINQDIISEEMKVEPLNSLILRVLYRVRSLSEFEALDGPTFSYVSPLLSCVVQDDEKIGSGEEDEPLERLALVINIVNFHTAEFVDQKYPRLETLSNLLQIVRKHPTLGKDASSALIAVGEAIHRNVTPEEIDVLIKSTLVSETYARSSALQCLQVMDLTDLDWSPVLWVVCYDNDQQNARMAKHLWEDNGLDIPETFFDDLKPFLDNEHACIRSSCSLSLGEAAGQWPQQVATIVQSLQDFYQEKAKITGPEFDGYGILITRSLDSTDPWPARLAVANSLEALAPHFNEDLVKPFFEFLINKEALGDANSGVRSGMLTAASKVIDHIGKARLPDLISTFETYLAKSSPGNETADFVKEAVVILLGRTASHLEVGDPRIPSVVDRLVLALKTPSEQVQVAVSECLAPLVKFITPTLGKLAESQFEDLYNSPKYGERRGAAYGLAGIIRGTGIAGITRFDLIERLRTALDDKKRFESRQGAMFALETLSASLGRNFEPYIIELLPSLLASFGDGNPDVREATEDAAKVIMANLSGYGVKQILPTLLSGLEEKQWRTKKGSIELLGMMSFCSPKQLSLSLPTVIPRLTNVLTDSHTQVRTAANRSLKQFGEVISNPEIQSLVPVLLKALVDPAKTPGAMSSLLKKSFAHYIDSPSLALVIPIIERGLRERGAETKRKAAQIVGNLASLTDSQDFTPYLTRLLPLVNTVLVDPVPEARATAAKALGTLIERLGEDQFPDMVPGLLRTLKSDSSGVDRQGAAQGLSEVLAGLGMERLEALLPDIVSNAQSPKSTVREGFMSLLVYLPTTFGSRFQPHLTKIVAPILSGLSDTEEYVREAAMRAGRMIITNYSNKAIDLLLPELERGMFDSSWRIRHSSITLVGELLFKISGISGKAEIEEEEEVEVGTSETSRKVLGDALGRERRDRVLSALYLVRQDAVSSVRQAAIHIWKALVHNTPRTVRELLPELISQLVSLLSDEDYGDSQETASRTVGELCRKFGERILGEILPILQDKSNSPDAWTRKGVCLVLVDIMETATDTQRGSHEDMIVAIVRTSLVDDDANVRGAAARAFDSLQEHLGAKAIDETIPTLLEALRQPGESSGTALQALKEVMNVRANTVFPVLIPTLTAPPMTVFNARALATLVTVAGNALSKRLTQVLNALVNFMEADNEPELAEAIETTVTTLLGSINDDEGLNSLMLILLDWVQSGGPIRRASACRLFGNFCEETELDASLYRIDWIRQLVLLLDDNEAIVHTAAWNALDLFVKSVPKDELEPLVVTLRRSIESSGAPGRFVPGFSLPKGVAPMVPIIIAGLTTGSNEQRENAAYAIGDLVTRTEENALKPFVVPFTGPLIRVAAQATVFPPGVKSAILSALTTMLEHIPTFVKPFFPQLQRTFVKATSDPSSLAVRNRAATALGALMKSQPRVDPVITELISGAKANDDAIAASHLNALAQVIKNAGNNAGEKAREMSIEVIEDAFKESHDDYYIQAVAALFASISQFTELVRPLVKDHLVSGTPASALSSHCILAVLSAEDEETTTERSRNVFERLDVLNSISRKVQDSISSDRPAISRPAREAKELLNTLL